MMLKEKEELWLACQRLRDKIYAKVFTKVFG